MEVIRYSEPPTQRLGTLDDRGRDVIISQQKPHDYLFGYVMARNHALHIGASKYKMRLIASRSSEAHHSQQHVVELWKHRRSLIARAR
jgi:hypothetical protein